ncbi:MAG: asparagine synthase C-terminal domain-containing protein, partial [Bacteroidia bacterium]|nr:asparagine synthase C-terminal domain-containing protein [Bacteroidia bacterium]
PYGSLLSGGIDSSLVTAIAREKAPGRLKTFTIGFKENAYDESLYAREVADFLGTEHHEYILEEREALEYVFKIPEIYDEPYADSSAIPTLLVSKMAASEVKMVLTGDGGDEMFLGYGSYHWAKRMANPFWYTLRKPVSMVLHTQDDHKKRAGDVFGYSKGSLQSHIFSQEQYFFSLPELERLMRQPADLQPSFVFEQEEAIQRQNAFDLRYYLKDDLLVKTDRASMHFGLEMRSPFLDKDLAAFALSLPVEMRMENNMLKGFLKKALYERIPESYFNRQKRGFAIPLKKWLQTDLYVLVEKYLSKEALETTAVLNPVMVREILHAWKHGADRLYNRIWAMILLQQFLMKNAG